MTEKEKLLYCSFCGKSQHEVRKLIAGPQVFICDECIELCNDIVREELQRFRRGSAISVRPSRVGQASCRCTGRDSWLARQLRDRPGQSQEVVGRGGI